MKRNPIKFSWNYKFKASHKVYKYKYSLKFRLNWKRSSLHYDDSITRHPSDIDYRAACTSPKILQSHTTGPVPRWAGTVPSDVTATTDVTTASPLHIQVVSIIGLPPALTRPHHTHVWRACPTRVVLFDSNRRSVNDAGLSRIGSLRCPNSKSHRRQPNRYVCRYCRLNRAYCWYVTHLKRRRDLCFCCMLCISINYSLLSNDGDRLHRSWFLSNCFSLKLSAILRYSAITYSVCTLIDTKVEIC